MIDNEKVIREIGTPTYVYDVAAILDRIKYLRGKLDADILYAVKANSFIVKEIEEEIDGYEICSKGEFDICNSLDISRRKMVISGVHKDRPSIEEMMENYDDIRKYTIESVNQWELLMDTAKKYGRHIHALIRLTSGNQFGVCEEDLKYIIGHNDEDVIEIDGIEYFSGTQKHSVKKINKETDKLIALIDTLRVELGFIVREIEYGPGLPIFYYQGEEFDEEAFLDEVRLALDRIKDKGVKLSLEVGRSLVAASGRYYTSIVDMKSNKNGNFVILDGGINHLVYYGGTLGMRIPHFQVVRITEDEAVNENDLITYNLHGSLCTVNDILVKNINSRKLKSGDVFIFENVGAYSSTEGISLFLSRDLPRIALCDKEGNLKVVREVIKTSEINLPRY
ncbi:MAG: hypothetical protein IJ054_05160 [Lachnospiraceae bacterium]|nr:hypothetical protein [Lachnospiraceae bacterium]MBQ9233325.1 hypothetical protein [Lachnospiraceae bacterium]